MTSDNIFDEIIPENDFPDENIPTPEKEDNDVSADVFDEPDVDNDVSADVFEETETKATTVEQKVQQPEQPAVGERSEIIYNNSESGYTCDVKTTKVKHENKGNGIKIAAIVIAALFTCTFMVSTCFSIADRMGAFGTSDKEEKSHVFQMDVPEGKNDTSEDGVTVNKPSATDKLGEVASASTRQTLTVNQIAEKCRPSSVGIMVETDEYYFGMVYKKKGVGSGFILSEDGYIATNNHVISGATRITVLLADGTEHTAKLIGADPVTDIAVIKVEATGLPVMERGNSDEVMVGDLAVAIGTPASIELAGTVTDGIISAVGRKIDITDSYGRVVKTMNLIQTNATINPGNSGGPLINRYGQVIGINTLKLTDEYEGIGFAIPINGAISIMNQLINDGEVTDRNDGLVSGKAAIGIQCYDITEAEANSYGIPQGVMVMQVNRNGSAAKAGLSRGDIIVKFNGSEVKTTEDMNRLKEKCSVGEEVTLTVYRDSQKSQVDITFKLDMQTE